MILTCPQCATRYQSDAAKFLPSGRTVRCAKCGHSWFQDPPVVENDATADIVVVEPPALPSQAESPKLASFSSNPVIARQIEEAEPPPTWPMKLATGAGWLGLVAIVLLIGWSAVAFRQQIATLWPQSASVYTAVGLKTNASGIDIQDVTYRRENENGQSVLAVAGVLVNTSTRELPVPQIRVALIDNDRRELYHWMFTPAVTTLRPGQSTNFLTRLSNPPAGARHFELRFAKAGE